MREPKPFFRKQTQSWYVKIKGEWRNLGKDKEAAFEEYHTLMTKFRERPTAATSAALLVDNYYKWCFSNLAETTTDRRKPILRSFAIFLGPRLNTRRLRPYHVLDWLAKDYPAASDTYRHTLMTVVKGAFQWASDNGYIDSNPLAKLKKPEPAVRQDYVPADVWPQVLALATDNLFRDFLTVMLASGARVHEMFIMERRHLTGQQLVFDRPESKGKKKSRVIWLPDDAFAIVKRLSDANKEGPLFLNRRGRPWNRNSLRCRFRRLKRELKMPNLTATTLRHSFAHHRLTSGQDSMVVSKLMGHVDGRMLATRYGHLEKNNEFMQAEANRIAIPQASRPEESSPRRSA